LKINELQLFEKYAFFLPHTVFVIIYFQSSARTSQKTHCIHYKNQPYECT